jgi:hypothetical protein
MARPVELRPLVCVMCGQPVLMRSVTSPSCEAPEMVQAPPGAWMGHVMGDVSPEMVLTCSEACVQLLLAED